jgi:hypothetical protein
MLRIRQITDQKKKVFSKFVKDIVKNFVNILGDNSGINH